MKKIYFLAVSLLSLLNYAQVGITNGSSNFDEKPIADGAVLELRSTNSGFLLPRLNQKQIKALAEKNPTAGLLIYDAENNQFLGWNGKEFQSIVMISTKEQNKTEQIPENGAIPKTTGNAIAQFFRKYSVGEFSDYIVVGSDTRAGSLNAINHFQFKSIKGSVVVKLLLSPYNENEKAINIQILKRDGRSINVIHENKIEIPYENYEYEYTFHDVPTDSYLALKADSKMNRFKILSCEVIIQE
ncbi:hypothetical protein ACT4R9_07735 [Ornithobacterium rhinotracheale]|uniref:hypothetical protein n=1 Tax=Ornithobacterium rhinotracheale TaxID=28251 RepID=UPI003FA436D4